MNKTLPLIAYGQNWNLALVKATYASNNNLHLGLMDYENGPFAVITTNIEPLPENQAAVDVNNCPWAEEFITANNLGTNTGLVLASGFCAYPVYEFDMALISELAL